MTKQPPSFISGLMLVSRSRFCGHKEACLPHALKGTARAIVLAYGLKGAIGLALGLAFRKLHKHPERVKEILGSDTMRFGLSFGSMVGLYKIVRCALRAVRRKEDGWNAFIAGGVSVIPMAWDAKGRRTELGLYVMSRAVDSIWNAMAARGWVKALPAGEAILFGFMCAFIMWSFTLEPQHLPQGYIKWIRNMGPEGYTALQRYRYFNFGWDEPKFHDDAIARADARDAAKKAEQEGKKQ